MLDSTTKSTRLVLALTVGIAVLIFAGCDSFGDESSGEEEKEDYEVTNDLEGRIDTVSNNDKGAVAGRKSATNISFDLEARIQPPTVNGKGARATSLNFDGNNNLYIGYLLIDNPFGGGIDILDAEDPTDLTGATSLRSENTDVQGMTSPPNEDQVYIAEATPPGESGKKSRVSVLRLENGAVNSTSKRLTGNVAKSVAVEPSDEGEGHDFHVITDNNALYRFEDDLNEGTMLRQTVGSDVDFSGLSTHQDMVFTLSVDGQIYYSDWSSANPLQNDAQNLDSGIERLGIGRLSAYDESDGQFTQDERLFAALGTKGFAVLDDDADDIKYRVTETGTPGPDSEEDADDEPEPGYYTSVTMHGKIPAIGGDLVYGARRYGIVDVYEVPSDGVSNGLTLIRRLYLREAFDLGGTDDTPPSVNYVLGVEGSNKLYVSGGKEGTLVLDLSAGENPKAISFAAFCTTQSDFEESDVSITNVVENDENEPIEISWESDTELKTVVLKAGPSMYNYNGGISGTARSEEGDVPGSSQSPPRPCPSGEDLIVKDENVGGN